MLKVERYQGLTTLAQPYSGIFEQASMQSFFLSLPWFENFEKTIVGQGKAVQIYGVEEPQRSHPLAALVMQCNDNAGGILSPVKMTGLSNYYTSYFAPVLATAHGNITEISRALASALWSDRKLWDVIDLQPLDQMSPVFTSLVQAFKEVGMFVQTYFCFGNWYLDVAGRSYAEYFKSLPSVLRKNIPYVSRKLDRLGRARIVIITGEEGLEQALDDYERVYNSSWKKREPYPFFIRGLVRTAMVNSWLRLGLVYVDGEPAAAQIWIVHAGVASIYKICYDERFSKLSVGTILTAQLMQYVIDVDKVKVVDYLSGDDAYKKNWTSHRRERWGIMAFNSRSLNGITHAIRHIGGRSIKNALRKIFPKKIQ